MLEQYEIEGEKFLQRMTDGLFGMTTYDPLKQLWDAPESEALWDDADWWEPETEVSTTVSTDKQEISIDAASVDPATQPRGEMGATTTEMIDPTTPSGTRWFKRYENGFIPEEAMVSVDGFGFMRPDAAYSMNAMRKAAAKDGVDLSGGGYRSYEGQVEAHNTKPDLAATPGHSNHGWGLAVDVNGADWNSEVYKWLTRNASRYGFAHPSWAQQDGSKPEPWHWEYVGGGEIRGTYKKKTTKKVIKEPKRKPSAGDLTQLESPLTGGGALTAAILGMATQELGATGNKRVRATFQFDRTPETKEEIIQAAKAMAASYGWTGKKWQAIRNIVEGQGDVPGESNWDTTALNPTSGATGIPQLNPNSHEVPAHWKNPLVQIRWMYGYLKQRYGDPVSAWEFKKKKGWY